MHKKFFNSEDKSSSHLVENIVRIESDHMKVISESDSSHQSGKPVWYAVVLEFGESSRVIISAWTKDDLLKLTVED